MTLPLWQHPMLRIQALLLTLLLLFSGAGLAQLNGTADTETTLPEPLTSESINALVSRLSDAQVRSLLLTQLGQTAEQNARESTDQPSWLTMMRSVATGIASNIATSVERLPDLAGGIRQGTLNWLNDRTISEILLLFGKFALLVLIALAAETLARMAAHRWRSEIETRRARSLWETVQTLVLRFFLDVVGIVVFALVLLWLIERTIVSASDQQLFSSFTTAIVITVRLTLAASRFCLAPNRPLLRLVAIDDHWARWLYRHCGGVALIMGLLNFIIPALANNGVPMGQLRLGFWLNLTLYVYLAWMVWTARHAISTIIRGGDDSLTSSENKLASLWPGIALALILINWLLVETIVSLQRFDLLRGQENLTLLLIGIAPVLDTMIRGLVRHLTPPMIGEGPVAERAWHATKRSYVRIGRVILIGLFILLIANLWGINLRSLASNSFGAQFAARAVEALLLLAGGYLAWEFVTMRINRRLAREHTEAGIDMESDEPGGGEGGGTGLSRLATILPLLLRLLQSIIVVITALLVLGQLGIDTTPLLAGAGIVGLAIGFGAQTFVRDVVSGLFFLLDDAFRVGEFINVEETRGTVERISIRSLQLRHHLGSIHTIPYGEIPKITNNSRDWTITKLRFTVPFDTDINQIKKIFKKIGQDMLMQPEYADIMLQPFKSQGVYDVDDVGIVVRGKFMSRPGTQYTLRKEIYTRVQKAFAEAGIEFARREVRVNIPGLDSPEQLTPEQQSAIAAAAEAADKR